MTDLDRFPYVTVRGTRRLHRVHRSSNWPWWFSDSGDGRFDPTGTGQGACYLAERPLGAWVEVFRKTMLIAEADVQARWLQGVELGRDVRVANLISRRALEFGVTASIGADERFTQSQEFARRAVAAGFGGVRYYVRHDPRQQLVGIAMFNDAGETDPADPDWPRGADAEIPNTLVAEARQVFGYEVLPTP